MKLARDALHILITSYALFGGMFAPNKQWLVAHIMFTSSIVFHWLTNNNRCALSSYDYDDQNGWTKELLSKTGIEFTDNQTMFVAYLAILVPLAMSVYRALHWS